MVRRKEKETTFEEWKYEVDCLRQDKMYTESQIGLAIRKSVRYQAKRVIMPLGVTATVEEIMLQEISLGSAWTE